MATHPSIPDRLMELARAQAGVLLWDQIRRCGLSERTVHRLVRDGFWTRLARGVYLTHCLAPDWLSLAWAGYFVAGDEAAIGGQAALKLAHIIDDADLPIPIVLPHTSPHRVSTSWWSFTRTRVPFRTMGDLPRLRTERAIIDLCAADPDRSAHWVTLAAGSRKASVQRMREELDAMPQCAARRQLTELLADAGTGIHSPLELVYLRDVERAHGMAPGRRQVRSGSYIRDVYYDEGLIVELDGRTGHEGIGAFRDMDRDNYHTMQGRPTLRYGWEQCHGTPCRTFREVAEMRHSLGWTGDIKRCRRCR